MGCICATYENMDHLIINHKDDILLYNKYSNKRTPSSYLIETSINKYIMPNFIIDFYDVVNNHHYMSLMQNKYKDLYFCNGYVYSIEFMKEYTYTNLKKVHEVVNVMNHVLSPLNSYYHAIDDEHGIFFQKMKRCNKRDLWYNTFGSNGICSIDVDSLVYSLANTLKTLHDMDIYLMDIKLENILGHINRDGITEWMFADIEYAWVDPPFVGHETRYPEEKMKSINKNKRRWVKTLHYLPDKTYPYCRRIAVRNDCFALARCIGNLICYIKRQEANRMFFGNKEMESCDLRSVIKNLYPEDKYLHICGDCVIEYDKYATHEFLNRLIDISSN